MDMRARSFMNTARMHTYIQKRIISVYAIASIPEMKIIEILYNTHKGKTF